MKKVILFFLPLLLVASIMAQVNPTTDGIDLPVSKSVEPFQGDIPAIFVSTDWLRFAGNNIVRNRDILGSTSNIIPELYGALQSQAQVQANWSESNHHSILLWMDKRIRFGSISRILSTCSRWGFDNYYFATIWREDRRENCLLIKTLSLPTSSVYDGKVPAVYLVPTDSFMVQWTEDNGASNHPLVVNDEKAMFLEFSGLAASIGSNLDSYSIEFACSDQIDLQFIAHAFDAAYKAGFNDLRLVRLRSDSAWTGAALQSLLHLKGGHLCARSREKADINNVVMNHFKEIQAAYTVRLEDRPSLQGRVIIKIMIDESGKVVKASIDKSTVDDAVLEHSIVKIVQTWDFGEFDCPGNMTEIRYPFDFSR